MDSQAKSGALSILTAIAAAIAPAVVKAVLSRRSRVPIKEGEHSMCRNHSHIAGRIYSLTDDDGVTEVKMLVTQPLTLETSHGVKLTLPVYTNCCVRVPKRDASLVSQLQEMAAQDEPALFKDESPSTSGPTILPR